MVLHEDKVFPSSVTVEYISLDSDLVGIPDEDLFLAGLAGQRNRLRKEFSCGLEQPSQEQWARKAKILIRRVDLAKKRSSRELEDLKRPFAKSSEDLYFVDKLWSWPWSLRPKAKKKEDDGLKEKFFKNKKVLAAGAIGAAGVYFFTRKDETDDDSSSQQGDSF